MRWQILALGVVVLVSMVGGNARGGGPYTVTSLGTLPGFPWSGVFAINAAGQVVGDAYKSIATYPAGQYLHRAFLFSNGTMVDLGTLGGGSSYAYGINASGQVAGSLIWAVRSMPSFIVTAR